MTGTLETIESETVIVGAGAAGLSVAACLARGGAEILPGLFFCGFHMSPTGMLREIAREARRVAGTILGLRS